jgi:sRNA-binding protein
LNYLRRHWPAAFTRPRPLALGIQTDLQSQFTCENTFEFYLLERAISATLEVWVTADPYLAACAGGATRIDLAGVTRGTVTEAEAAYARERLAGRCVPPRTVWE